jgi:thiol-disulfide isomerase/thioredoxin
MIRKNILVLVGIIIVLVILAVATYYIRTNARYLTQNEANKTLFSNEVTAEFLDDQSNPVNMEQFEDNVLIVNVWASWSPYTEIEFPILNEISQQYRERGVKVLAMNRKESQTQIERYLATIPPYEHIEQIIDVNDFFYAGIDGYAMPETIIYDAQGKIIQHIRGVIKKEELVVVLDTIISEQN